MRELEEIKALTSPTEIILVLDAMTGQDAVNIAQGFSSRGLIDSLILTKLDSDTRGGAALSVRAVTGKPIKFVGVGEKTDQLEQFHPQRMASQILGMGDVLTLIERAEAAFDQEQALKLQEKLRKQQFTLEDFRDQLRQFRSMGSLDEIVAMLPGAAKLGNMQLDERELVRFDAIIASMTPAERLNPSIINGSRRKRIARGSGTSVQHVNKLLKQFAMMQKMFKQFDPKQAKKGRLNFPFKF
jgi:signal recognition particle subunit SRP54